MKDLMNTIKNNPIYFGIFFLIFSMSSCEDDDDGIIEAEPTGVIEVEDPQVLTGDSIMVESVDVGQESWLVAVNEGEENTTNFITDPDRMEEGVNSDIELVLNENASLEGGAAGDIITLVLFADNPDEGTQGEWDDFDEPIFDENGVLVTESITVFTSSAAAFNELDANDDDMLNMTEIAGVYQDDFDEWDADDDGFINQEEFPDSAFALADADNDDGISEDEWNLGYDNFYNPYIEDDFATFDADADGILSNDEWNDAFADTEWFGVYDADDDDMIAETEWDEGLFGDWDANDDESIDEDEFDLFDDFFDNW